MKRPGRLLAFALHLKTFFFAQPDYNPYFCSVLIIKEIRKFMIQLQEILWNLRIDALNAMQEETCAAYRKGKDLVLLSPTGSGKTLACLIPLVQSLKETEGGVQAVILVPSRELALQIEQVFKAMKTPFRIVSCYGGRPAMEEHRTLKQVNPHVVVATPGRMNDHLGKENIVTDTVHTLVIDEFDKCLELGFQDEMAQVLSRLQPLQRRFLLSATDAEQIPAFVSDRDFTKLDFLDRTESVTDRVQVRLVKSPQKDKLDTLANLLGSLRGGSSMVFVNYRESVERTAAFLKSKGFFYSSFHGGMEQKDRERALYKFSNGSCNVLVTTDLAARGLDIADVDHIIHYHLPLNEEAYIHRNGRTARWDAEGNAYVILGPEEHLPEYMPADMPVLNLHENGGRPRPPKWITLYIGKGKKDKINKVDIVGFLSKVGGLQKEEIGRIDVKEHYAFVAVARACEREVLARVKGQKIKGIKCIIEKAL